jgi:hypothetical protein
VFLFVELLSAFDAMLPFELRNFMQRIRLIVKIAVNRAHIAIDRKDTSKYSRECCAFVWLDALISAVGKDVGCIESVSGLEVGIELGYVLLVNEG